MSTPQQSQKFEKFPKAYLLSPSFDDYKKEIPAFVGQFQQETSYIKKTETQTQFENFLLRRIRDTRYYAYSLGLAGDTTRNKIVVIKENINRDDREDALKKYAKFAAELYGIATNLLRVLNNIAAYYNKILPSAETIEELNIAFTCIQALYTSTCTSELALVSALEPYQKKLEVNEKEWNKIIARLTKATQTEPLLGVGSIREKTVADETVSAAVANEWEMQLNRMEQQTKDTAMQNFAEQLRKARTIKELTIARDQLTATLKSAPAPLATAIKHLYDAKCKQFTLEATMVAAKKEFYASVQPPIVRTTITATSSLALTLVPETLSPEQIAKIQAFQKLSESLNTEIESQQKQVTQYDATFQECIKKYYPSQLDVKLSNSSFTVFASASSSSMSTSTSTSATSASSCISTVCSSAPRV